MVFLDVVFALLVAMLLFDLFYLEYCPDYKCPERVQGVRNKRLVLLGMIIVTSGLLFYFK